MIAHIVVQNKELIQKNKQYYNDDDSKLLHKMNINLSKFSH
jgi:hypothetical protein